jgi:hypothetical protein
LEEPGEGEEEEEEEERRCMAVTRNRARCRSGLGEEEVGVGVTIGPRGRPERDNVELQVASNDAAAGAAGGRAMAEADEGGQGEGGLLDLAGGGGQDA